MNGFDYYQRESGKTAIYPYKAAREYLALGLASEAGEVAGLIKKEIRDGVPVLSSSLIKELGDVLWYLSETCNAHGILLSEVATANLEKLRDRQDRGVIGGSGDER